MKQLSIIRIAVFFVLIFITLNRSYAYADFYVIATGSKPVGTEIKSLPYTIRDPGFYFLTKTLICPINNTGIIIAAQTATVIVSAVLNMIVSLS